MHNSLLTLWMWASFDEFLYFCVGVKFCDPRKLWPCCIGSRYDWSNLFDSHDAKKRCKSFDLFFNRKAISIATEKKHPSFPVHILPLTFESELSKPHVEIAITLLTFIWHLPWDRIFELPIYKLVTRRNIWVKYACLYALLKATVTAIN